MSKIKNKLFTLIGSFILFFVVILSYGYYEYLNEKETIYKQIDERLITSANASSLLLQDDFFDKSQNLTSVSSNEDMENIKKLTTFANNIKVIYIYTLTQKDGKIHFTSSSATKEELETSLNLTRYFDEYDDANDELKDTFKDKKIHFSEYSDKWGTFRSVFIPKVTAKGTFYVVASDIKIDRINSLVRQKSFNLVLKISLLILFGLALFLWQLLLMNKKLSKHNKTLVHDKDLLLSLFDNSNSVLFKLKNDENLTIEYVSNSVEKLLGYKKSELVDNLNLGYLQIVDKTDFFNIKEEIFENIENNRNYFKHLPYHIVTKESSLKYVLDETVIIRDENGEVTNYLVYIIDITEQKEREKAFVEQNKLASMGEMIGNIAHQWRQPLSVISSIVSSLMVIREYGDFNAHNIDEDLEKILEQTQYLSKTVDDFRNFLKNDQKKQEIFVKEILEKTCSIVSPILKDEHITFVMEVDSNIKLSCFPNELLQCFMNIINNAKDAIKDKKSKEDKKIILIKAQNSENSLDIFIQDNAQGIANNIINRVFEPYFTTKHQSVGTGLGLSMTYKILKEHHNADISVDNRSFIYENIEYFGACFKISFKTKNS